MASLTNRYILAKNDYLNLSRTVNHIGGSVQLSGSKTNTFKQCLKHHNTKFKHLIGKFFGDSVSDALQIIYKNINNDNKIYRKLSVLYSKKHQIETETNKTEYRKIVAVTKLNHIKKYLDKHVGKYDNILDIGCEDCFQVEFIKDYLKIGNAHCINIENWDNTGYGIRRDTCNFKLYDGFNIPYKENTMDVILLFQTLHHIKNVENYIVGLKKVLKPGGLLIIREHNSRDKFFDMLIDIEHGLYDVVRDKNMNFFDNYYGNYNSMIEWDKIIGLKKVFFKEITSSPTGAYYAIYEK